MAKQTIEERLERLEAEVASLKHERSEQDGTAGPWWERIRGRFKDDPAYEEAMRYGREYRESLKAKVSDNDAA
ncbi:MAG TPA: hypothetical protein VFA70_08660 [Dehalococcoidia bacterium]|nr:hypothetical protein [Dehalococcoidia bacterium]